MNSIFYKNQVIQICSEYAGVAHIGQLRKDKVTPYITHPARVACLTSQYLRNEIDVYLYIAAAWLHDVMEDCSKIVEGEYSYRINNHVRKDSNLHKFLHHNRIITPEDGARIFELIEVLTMSQDKSIPKKDRRKIYFKEIKKAGPEVSVIKYCDRIDNIITVYRFSQSGMSWYLEETDVMMKKIDLSIYISLSPVHRALKEQLKAAKQQYKEMYETV